MVEFQAKKQQNSPVDLLKRSIKKIKSLGESPFKYYDPRSSGLYKGLKVPFGIVIPTTDPGAWEQFKEHRWVYNKIEVALSQGLICAPMGVKPKRFPVLMKPIYNLRGMGIGIRKLSSSKEYENSSHLSGYFWMEYLQGDHLSLDIVAVNGIVIFCITFKGYPLGQGMFDYWETIETPKNTFNYVAEWVRKNLRGYRGCLNIETIGNKITECHLRMGDIDGLGNLQLMQSIVDVYSGKEWKFKEKIPKFYQFVLWGEEDIDYEIDKKILFEVSKNLIYCDIKNQKLNLTNPPGGVRIAILGSYNKEYCIKARNELYENFTPKPRKPKIDY